MLHQSHLLATARLPAFALCSLNLILTRSAHPLVECSQRIFLPRPLCNLAEKQCLKCNFSRKRFSQTQNGIRSLAEIAAIYINENQSNCDKRSNWSQEFSQNRETHVTGTHLESCYRLCFRRVDYSVRLATLCLTIENDLKYPKYMKLVSFKQTPESETFICLSCCTDRQYYLLLYNER